MENFYEKLFYRNKNIPDSLLRQYLDNNLGLLNIKDIFAGNSYINNRIDKSVGDVYSLCYIIDKKLTQSESIKVGYALESVIRDIILKYSNFKDIKPKNSKGNREKDHLFINDTLKLIIYAECKSNLNLDTEKSKSTIDKINSIKNELTDTYKDFNIKCFLINLRYYNTNDIPSSLCKKFKNVCILGVKEYLQEFDINVFEDEKQYINMINELAQYMFKL